MNDGHWISYEAWDECALPEGFTAADDVALMAIESGVSLSPWQFDLIARFFSEADR